MKVLRYLDFVNEGKTIDLGGYKLPTYDQAVEMSSGEDSPFYESKLVEDGYNISIFNYRLAQYKDFVTPMAGRDDLKGYEMRGLTFVFNEDGSLYNRFLLLEKFFNLNQVPESMYSIVKNYKIKYVNNKEDGSIASFIKLPNGTVLGKSKMSFESDQALGITKIYKTNADIKKLVDWALDNDIVAIFEYVAPHNRIVLRYPKEELILLRLRDNKTGKHIDLKDHLDKIGSVKIAPFEDEYNDLDHLMEVVAKQEEKEGVIVQAEDVNGNDFFFKLKTPWYVALHGLLTDDIYKENIIIGYILDDKIDDILGQIPETEVEAHDRIEKIIKIIKDSINEKVQEINKLYDVYLEMGSNDKNFALKYRKDSNFGYVMIFARCNKLKKLSKEEILEIYDSYSDYEKAISRGDIYELVKDYIGKQTSKLEMARNWLEKKDSSLFFKDIEEQ